MNIPMWVFPVVGAVLGIIFLLLVQYHIQRVQLLIKNAGLRNVTEIDFNLDFIIVTYQLLLLAIVLGFGTWGFMEIMAIVITPTL